MPNRIIKESSFTSERLAKLGDFEFRLWVGLITAADDLGRGDARPAILKGRLFALREEVSAADIERALGRLEALGCIRRYCAGGGCYYFFPSWNRHQRVRKIRPRYPAPPDECGTLPQSAAICGEVPQAAANCGLNPIQSESESEYESESESEEGMFDRFAGSNAALRRALEDFGELREQMGKPLTRRGRELLLEQLKKFSASPEEQVEILNRSVAGGWQGIFPLSGGKPGGPLQASSAEAPGELELRMVRRLQ